MTLRARLILAATYVLLVVTIGIEVPLAVTVRAREVLREQSDVLNYAALLAARINDDLPKASPDPTVVDRERHLIADLTRTTARATGVRYLVVDAGGRVIADSTATATVGANYATEERPEFQRVFGQPGGDISVGVRRSDTLNRDLIIVAMPVVHFREAIGAVRASEPVSVVNSTVYRTWITYAIIGVLAILVGLAATWILATSLVRPVRRLEDTAVKLGEGDLDARAEPEGPAEVATLAGAFNQMATALSTNITAQRDFLANASHQLRTPLTGLRLRLEAIQHEGGFAAEQAQKAEAEVDRLAGLVRDLLVLARASSVESSGAPLDLGEVARGALDRWAATAESKGKTMSVALAERAPVWADAGDVDHVLDNLIENAIRYTPEGTTISLEAWARNGTSYLAVADDGPGIPPEDQSRIFERFYRGNLGRRTGPGTGLGLAIVAELVQRWKGDIRLAGGIGARFELSFPAGRSAEAPRATLS